MSNREIVIDVLPKLPEGTSLEEIAREIEMVAGIKGARGQALRREGIRAEDARKLVDTWVTAGPKGRGTAWGSGLLFA